MAMTLALDLLHLSHFNFEGMIWKECIERKGKAIDTCANCTTHWYSIQAALDLAYFLYVYAKKKFIFLWMTVWNFLMAS